MENMQIPVERPCRRGYVNIFSKLEYAFWWSLFVKLKVDFEIDNKQLLKATQILKKCFKPPL